MAVAATVPPFISLSSSTKILRSSLPPFPPIHYSLNHHHHYAISHNANPRRITCLAKPSMVEEAEEEVDGALFDGDDLMDDDESDEDETESSLDLLFRFLQSMFKKVSKRAKKASRSILPSVISPQLVSFAVDGVFLLASLSIVKALLEVVCTIGGTVFVVILLLRVIWAAFSHFQSNGNDLNQSGTSYRRTQPVT